MYAWIIYLPAYSDLYNVQSSHVNYYRHNIIITHKLGWVRLVCVCVCVDLCV